jgi:hypothetical protein
MNTFSGLDKVFGKQDTNGVSFFYCFLSLGLSRENYV